MEHLGDLRLRQVGGVPFGGRLVWFPIKAAWRLAFVQVKFVLNLLLATLQRNQTLGVFKRRFDLGLCVHKALA